MNLIIYFNRKNIMRTKINRMKKVAIPSCENAMLNAKLEVLLAKINGLERFT
jgi:hypothetical protein